MIARLLLNMTISNAAISRHCSNSPFLIMQNSRSSLMLNKILFANSFSPLLRSNILNDIKITKSTFNNILSSVVHSSSASISYSYQVFESPIQITESVNISNCYFKNVYVDDQTVGIINVKKGDLKIEFSTFFHCSPLVFEVFCSSLIFLGNRCQDFQNSYVIQNKARDSELNESSIISCVTTKDLSYYLSNEGFDSKVNGFNITHCAGGKNVLCFKGKCLFQNSLISNNTVKYSGIVIDQIFTITNLNYFYNDCHDYDFVSKFNKPLGQISNSCFMFMTTDSKRFACFKPITINDCCFNVDEKNVGNLVKLEKCKFNIDICPILHATDPIPTEPIIKNFKYDIIANKEEIFEYPVDKFIQ